MLNSHRSPSSGVKEADVQTGIMNQIYKYSAIHPLKVAQPGKGKSSSKAGKKILSSTQSITLSFKKRFVNSKYSSYMTT